MNVQHLKLSLWWSDNDDHPLLGIHSFCRGDLKEVIKKKRRKKNFTYAPVPINQMKTGRQQASKCYH